MSSFRKYILAGVGVLAVLPWATAQQAVQPQGKVQVTPGQVTPGQGNQPAAGYRGPLGQTPWFGNPNVRQQLGFNDTQFSQMNNAYRQAWSAYQQGLTKMTPNLTPEQRSEQMRTLQQNFYNNFSQSTSGILTDPQMRNRFNQLSYQYRGYDALLDPSVQRDLKFTDEQRQKLNEYNQNWNNSMNELYRDYGTNRDDATRRFTDLQAREQSRINEILTEQQRQSWRQMIGDPYRFQLNQYFPSNNTTRPNE